MINILFILVSAIIIYIIKHKLDKSFFLDKNKENTKYKDIEQDNIKKEDTNNEKTILGLNKFTWGWTSVFTNGISVLIQLINLYKTKSAQSFSMPFIALMTLLNFTYFVLGILTANKGLALATFSFVVYNLIVVYYYYFGKK